MTWSIWSRVTHYEAKHVADLDRVADVSLHFSITEDKGRSGSPCPGFDQYGSPCLVRAISPRHSFSQEFPSPRAPLKTSRNHGGCKFTCVHVDGNNRAAVETKETRGIRMGLFASVT